MITVGFDLDLTLADTRAGIKLAMDTLSAEAGVWIDSALVISRLGPPLETELANWFDAEAVPRAAARYRELYAGLAVPLSTAMPGAGAAVAAVRADGGRIVVVTAKSLALAEATLAAIGIDSDAVAGSVWADAKGAALRRYETAAYVGDHLGDIRAARAGGALSVTVATGPFDHEQLRRGGADVVLSDLRQFPDWWSSWQAAQADSRCRN